MQVKIKIFSWAAGILFTLLILGGCTGKISNGTQQKPEMQGPFRHRWWNYYARGLSAAEDRQRAAAMADLRTALHKRDRDQYMARTYGMHFVDYFPHRELGILFWETRRLADAQDHLETSIQQTPTAKAVYYLDRVREERIRRLMQKDARAIQPPAIRIRAPETGILTRDDPVVISGTATDPNYVSALTVGGQSVYLNGSQRVVDFRQKVDLAQGVHRIRITAGSLSGLSHEKSLTVRVDRKGPLIEVRSVVQTADGSHHHWVISGNVMDGSGVASLKVNASAVTIQKGEHVAFRIPLAQGSGAVTVSATDQLGNATRSRFHIDDLASLERQTGPILLASREMPDLAGRFTKRPDRRAPTIELIGWTASQTVYMDKVVIEGSVKDDGGISHIFINHQPFNETALTGVLAAFNTSITLSEGPNDISIEATDANGNRSVKKIRIMRRIPRIRFLDERLSVGILPFALHGRISTTSDAFQDIFMQQLALRNRFKLVDRMMLDVILQEHKINRTDLIASDTTLKMGRLAAADAFINGSVIETRMGTEVISRFVDTETAEVLAIVDTFIETQKMPHIKKAAEHLSIKLHREFPIVGGDILGLQKYRIITSLGQIQLRAQRRFLVVEEQPVLHPITRHPLGHDYKVLGRGRLLQIQENFSKGRLQKGCDPSISTSHSVYTQ